MATFEQRQEAIRRAVEVVRNGSIWVRRAENSKVVPRTSKQDRSSIPAQSEPRPSE
jgi:hypothetical protein